MHAETRQRLLELVYDLLPDDEAAPLRGRIESDAEMAAAYREAQETARLLAEAARAPSGVVAAIQFGKVADQEKPASLPTPAAAQALAKGATAGNSFARAANWAVGLAAAVLVLISVGGYFYHREKLAAIAAKHLRLVVTGPSTIHAGFPSEYLVTTTDVDNQPLPAKVEVELATRDGQRLKAFKETVDEYGHLRVAIPADLKLPAQTQFRVVAWHGESHDKAEATLAVEPSGYDAQLALDRPLYQPGDTVRYRSLVLSRFGLTADRDVPVHFEIIDPAGAVVANSPLDARTKKGVASGAFVIPGQSAGGQYTLVARAADGSFLTQKRKLFVRRYRVPRLKKELEFARDSYGPGQTIAADFKAQRSEGGAAGGAKLRILATVDGQTVFDKNTQASDAGTLHVEFPLPKKIERGDGQLAVIIDDGGSRETEAKTIPINLGKVDVTFYPEGGELAAGLENRVYFVARNPQGKPVDLSGTLVAEQPGDRGPVDQSIPVQVAYEGMGSFSFTPTAGTAYRLKITQPTGVSNEPKLPAVSNNSEVVLNTGAGVFPAKKPLEFNIRSMKAGQPLVVAAYCRGVQVGQQPLVTKSAGGEANPVSIALDDAVGGVIRLTVYNYGVTPPKPVAERLVYRRPAGKLNVRASGHSERYAPGEKVDMSLLVTDENGKPAPAVLGVAVADDAVLNLADDRTPSMPTHFLLTSEIEKPEDLEHADFFLSGQTKGKTTSAEALDLLLGTQGWRRFVEKSLLAANRQEHNPEKLAKLAVVGAGQPPLMSDNIEQIRANYKKCLADYQADRTRALNTLTAASFFGGLGLVLLVAMLGVMRIVSGLHLWVSAIGATTCCLIVGWILMDPGRLTPGQSTSVAFLSYHAPVPEVAGVQMYGYGGGVNVNALYAPTRRMLVRHGVDGGGDLYWVAGGSDYGGCLGRYVVWDVNGGAWQWGMVDGDMDVLQRGRRFGHDGLDVKQNRAKYFFAGNNFGLDWVVGEGKGKALRLGTNVVAREFAHSYTAGKSDVRSDFSETLYWNPMLIADADGRAPVHFDLSDAVTAFRLTADAHGSGRLGTGRAEIVSRIPFNLEPKLPLEVNTGDRIDLPLAIVNDTKAPLPVELTVDCGKLVKLEGWARRKLTVPANQRTREYFVFDVTGQKGKCNLTFNGTAGRLRDAVTRPLHVVPPGFPKVSSYSGQLSGPQELTVKLPQQWVPGSLEVSLNVFPSSLADLQKGLDGILQEPNGCFEQASTSNYPNVMTMQYMQQHDAADPAVISRTKDLLKKGYARLTGYECKQHGYEWFGGDPGHEALTAYGLMQFRDMEKVFDVDPAMLGRTAEWLLARRDGHGGFQRNAKSLDSFGQAPADVTDAYVTWALSESGQSGIDAEVKHTIELGRKSDDAYLVALAAATALNAKQPDEGRKLLERLAKSQADDGHLDSRTGSITRSGGQSLQVETTALAALAWLKSPEFAVQAEKAVKWIIAHREGGGGFGSTQATILGLKALVEHAKANRRTANAGTLSIERGGRTLGQHSFSAGMRETIAIDGLEAALTAGDNRLTINLTGDNKMPYMLNVSYRTLKPESSDACPVRLVTRLASAKVKAGETVALSAELTNTADAQPMTMAILGLPAGLEPRPDQLEELKKGGTVDYYETRPREVICYWRGLAPKRHVSLKLDLTAAVPGRYTGPASRAYLYYTPENKQWCDPLAVEISR
jgi:alpha-2-macroglobulin-like protein